MRQRYFELPPARAFAETEDEYLPGFATYTDYNYCGGGLVARVKAAHFEAALALTEDLHGTCGAIDFGCADGVFLPSLAHHFQHVYAVDVRRDMVSVASRLREELDLGNVEIVCNDDLDFTSLTHDLRGRGFRAGFMLETLEHIGEPGRLYESRANFAESVLDLLEPGGRLVISVPTMIGLPFLIQRAVLKLRGMEREAITKRDLIAAVAHRTDALEPDWSPNGHLGFNHVKLEQALRARFPNVQRRSLWFTQVFVVSS